MPARWAGYATGCSIVAEAFDLDPDHIAGGSQRGGCIPIPDTARGAGQDHVAGASVHVCEMNATISSQPKISSDVRCPGAARR